MMRLRRRPTVRGERLYRALLRLYPPRFRRSIRRRHGRVLSRPCRGEPLGRVARARLAASWRPISSRPPLAEWAVAIRSRLPAAPSLHSRTLTAPRNPCRFSARIYATRSATCAAARDSPPSSLRRSRSASAPTRRSSRVVDAVLLRPLPYAHVERIVDARARTSRTRHGLGAGVHGLPARHAGAREARGVQHQRGDGRRSATNPIRARGSPRLRDFFDILGSRPDGRAAPSRRTSSAPSSKARVVVISHRAVAAAVRRRSARRSAETIADQRQQRDDHRRDAGGIRVSRMSKPAFWTPWRLESRQPVDAQQSLSLAWSANSRRGRPSEQATRPGAHARPHDGCDDFPETYFTDGRSSQRSRRCANHLSRPDAAVSARAARRRRIHPAHRVRQRREPAARARRSAAQGVRDSHGARAHRGARVVRQLLTESLTFAVTGAVVRRRPSRGSACGCSSCSRRATSRGWTTSASTIESSCSRH